MNPIKKVQFWEVVNGSATPVVPQGYAFKV